MTNITQATIDDAELLADMGRISFIESHGSSAAAADINEYVAQKYSVAAVRKDLEQPKHIYHIISHNGRQAGYSRLILNAAHPQIAAQNITCLDRLYLLRDFYDLKLGRQLFEHILALSKQAGQAGMWLYT